MILVNSAVVKTTSLLHIADTFPYKLLPDTPTTLFHPGPLISEAWERLLATHPDRCYAHIIVQIIRHGARIGYTGPDQLIFSPNLPSANDSVETLDRDLQEQRAHHRLMPVPTPGERFICSLLDFRMTHTLPYKHCASGFMFCHSPLFPYYLSISLYISHASLDSCPA